MCSKLFGVTQSRCVYSPKNISCKTLYNSFIEIYVIQIQYIFIFGKLRSRFGFGKGQEGLSYGLV